MADQACCLHCRHFRNTPAYLEGVFKGLISLGSGYGSVRKDDGVCLEHDLYLSAMASCGRFAARQANERLRTV
jgi:hypothetical protein